MNKKQFVQAALIRQMPRSDGVAAAVAHAEGLWDALTQAGYGDTPKAEKKPRVSHDHYAALDPRQKQHFDAFWQAFGLKAGRNEAAERWRQLGELTDGQYQEIIAAAKQEALRELKPGQARKHAQGWLFDKRWLDHAPAAVSAQNAVNREMERAMSELAHITRLHQQSGGEALVPQIDRLRGRIAELRGAQ